MVDNAQKVQVEAELDASATVSGARAAARELTGVIAQAAELEKLTRAIFTGKGNLPRELQAFTQALQQVQNLPAQMAQVQRLTRNLSSGGPATAISNASVQGVISTLRADPAMQLLRTEQEMNKVLNARGEIYKRIRQVMPDDASVMRINKSYREALSAIGDMPVKGSKEWDRWMERTRTEARRFEQDHTKMVAAEVEKRNKDYLRAAQGTMTQERKLQSQHQQELSRLFRRDMAGIMTGDTAEQRRAAAADAVSRLQGYAGRQGMTGFNEQRLLDMYEDAEARRTARDLTRAPARQPLSDNERAGRAYQQRDAFMNYNGGANRIASRFQFAGDFAAVGAVMGTAMYAGRSTVQLQSELKNLQAITKATDIEMKSLQGTIFGVGQTTKYSTQEIAQAATVMGQAGYSAAQIRDALPSIANLATAAGGDLSDTVATVTSVLSIYDMSIDRTAAVSNQLAEALNGSKLSFQQLSLGLQYAGNVAADGGIQFEELTAALGAMANAGIRSGSTLGTGLRALTQELENPNEKFLEWLKSVGLTADDVDIRTQGLAGALGNLTAKSFDSGKAMNVFEIRAAAAFSALSNNLDVMEDLQNDMTNTSAATEGAAVQMESLAAQGQRMANSLTEFTTVAGAPLIAFMTGLMSAVADVTTGLAGMGPIVQIVTTALAFMVAIQVGKWLLAMAAGFLGMTPAIRSAQLGLVALNFQVGGFTAVAGLATQSLRAFSAALLASPLGIITIGLTVLTTAFTAQQAASARTAQELDKYRTKANEAAAESQKLSDRTEELSSFMETLVQRSRSMGDESTYAGQMAEQASAKFAAWGLTLEGNITTVDSLIEALSKLSSAQASAALNQKEVERTALEGQRDTLIKAKPWDAVGGAVRGLTMTGTETAGGRYAAPAAGGMQLGPLLQNISPLLAKASAGTLTQAERNNLVGQLTAMKVKVPAASANIDQLVMQLNSENINALYKVQSDLKDNEKQLGTLRVAASPQMEAARNRSAQLNMDLGDSARAVSAIADPASRVRAATARQADMRRLSGYNDDFLADLARQTLDANPEIRTQLADRARMTGRTVEELLVAQMREGNSGFGQVDLQAGDPDAASNNPKALRARERALRTRIQETGALNDPAERNSTRQGLEAELRQIVSRRVALDNNDMDPTTLNAMIEEELGKGTSAGNISQETSEQRAARERSGTLRRSVKLLEKQIESASFNVAGPVGAAGTDAEQRALRFLVDKGLTPQQAAGIVGNLVHESAGMNTQALGDNGSAYGLAQWRGDRRAGLDSFARGRGTASSDFDTQMEFLWKELNDRGDLSAIQGQSTAAGAAEQFARKFERPRGAEGPLANLAGWSDRLAQATRLAGSGSTTEIDQTAVKSLLDQWKSTNIEQITADARASNISDAELKERLADFEITAQEYFNDVLTGNATKIKALLAADVAQRADTNAASTSVALRQGGALDEGLKNIQIGYDLALQAAIEASDAEFRSKGSEVDPAISAEAAAARRKIVTEFAGKSLDAAMNAIEQFFAGELERVENEFAQLEIGIERERSKISALSNSYGSRNLSDVQRALGGMTSEKLDIDSSRNSRDLASAKLDVARNRQATLQTQYDAASDPAAKSTIGLDLASAKAEVTALANEMTRAQLAYEAMTLQTPQFTSAVEAAGAAWQVFVDQQNTGRGVWEDVADGLVNTFNVAQSSFKTLVVDVLSGTKSMGDAFKDFTLSILQSLLDLVAELIAKKALQWIITFVASSFGGGGSTGGLDAQGSAMLNGSNQYANSIWAWHGGPVRARNMALGGSISGSNPNRDSVLINAMPGEFIMSKSAVDMVGEDALRAINAQGNSRMSDMPSLGGMTTDGEGGIVNVWIVTPDQKPSSIGKRDIVAAVSDDIMTGGTVKKLIKQVVMGG